MFLALELLVRIFHLQNERPNRYADEKGVEKWVPNQEEFSITGNRKQNVGKYHINNFGFNSVHENYTPKNDANEIAIIGDSFIEGFHEDYTNSLGQQVEQNLENTTVLEFGYAGYDLADELHLIEVYSDLFDKIDHSFIFMRFTDDLERDNYDLSSRLSLDTPISKIVKQVKLLVYLKDIGALDPLLQLPGKVINFVSNTKLNHEKTDLELKKEALEQEKLRFQNFKTLLEKYPIDKNRFIFLLDSSLCSDEFLNYLNNNNYNYLDLNSVLSNSEKPTTLIYDQHWSKSGRKLIASLIVSYSHKNFKS
jgi:hypothetical protein